jgi:hypothetical protein
VDAHVETSKIGLVCMNSVGVFVAGEMAEFRQCCGVAGASMSSSLQRDSTYIQ